MAKANGNVLLEGTLNNMTFYKRDGRNFVRRKGGVSKERIQSDPNYVRTRENNSEFTLCAGAGRTLRMALGSLVFKTKFNRLSGRMLQELTKIKHLDTISARGQRQVAIGLSTAEGKLVLNGFDFNTSAPLASVMSAAYELDIVSGKISFTDVVPLNQLLIPEGATHASFQSGVLGIDFDTEVSELVLSNIQNLPIDLTPTSFTLVPASVPVTTGVTLYLLKVSFYQEVNGVQYSLKNEDYSALRIIEVI